MSSEFSVFIEDVKQASTVFQQASKGYESLMPDGGFGCPSGGDGAFDEMLGVTMRTIGEMHKILAQALDQHGLKLGLVHARYVNSELANTASVAGLLEDMPNSAAPGLNDKPSF